MCSTFGKSRIPLIRGELAATCENLRVLLMHSTIKRGQWLAQNEDRAKKRNLENSRNEQGPPRRRFTKVCERTTSLAICQIAYTFSTTHPFHIYTELPTRYTSTMYLSIYVAIHPPSLVSTRVQRRLDFLKHTFIQPPWTVRFIFSYLSIKPFVLLPLSSEPFTHLIRYFTMFER